MKIIECSGVSEQLAKVRPEFVRFYAAWKRILTIHGWEKLVEHFPDDASRQGHDPRIRTCTIGYMKGPAYLERLRVQYNAKKDDQIYVMEVGDLLAVDRVKD